MMYTVAIYLTHLAYGGPEEGGWYYSCGEPVFEEWALPYTQHFYAAAEANEFRQMVEDTVTEAMNEGKPDISSVASEGRYEACVVEGYELKSFPETRPHYE